MNTKKAKSPLNGSVDLLSKALRDVIVEAVAHDRLETREVLRAGIREDVRIAVKESESVLLESHESDMKEFSKKVDSSWTSNHRKHPSPNRRTPQRDNAIKARVTPHTKPRL